MTALDARRPARVTGGAGGAVVALACYTTLFLAFFWRSLFTSWYIAPGDTLDFGVASFLSPQTAWTDGMYAGYPIAADPQAMMWYPLFRAVRAAGLGWNLFLVSAFPIAGLTMFLFVRRLTGSFLAALFAGLVYSFAATMLAHLNHVTQIHAAAWVPLLLYGCQRVRQGAVAAGIAAGSAGLAMATVAGHPQEMVYGVYLASAFVAACAWSSIDRHVSRASFIAAVAGIFVLGFGLAAVQLLPARELAELGTRAEANWELYVEKSLPPSQLVTMLLPLSFGGFRHDFAYQVSYFGESSPVEMTVYFGLVPLLLASVCVWHLPRLRGEALFWLAAGAVALLVALGDATPLGTLAFHLPLYGSFRVPARHSFVVALCGAVAAGVVLSVVLADRTRWYLVRRAGWYGLGAAAVAAALHFVVTPDSRRLLAENSTYSLALTMPAAVLLGLVAVSVLCEWRRVPPAVFGTLLIALQLADLGVLNYVYPGYMGSYAEVPARWVAPRPRIVALRDELHARHSRLLVADGSANAFIKPNFPRTWDVPSATGSGPMATRRYRAFVRQGGPGDVDPASFSKDNVSLDLLRVEYALLPVDWEVARDGTLDGGRWTRVDRIEWAPGESRTTYDVIRNTRIFPRAWLVPEVRTLEADEIREAVHIGRLPGGQPFAPRAVALVEPGTVVPLGARPPTSDACGRVAIVAEAVWFREYDVSATAACLLVLSEVVYPWWHATIDGRSVDVVPTDLALVGLPVAAGTNRVRIELVPRSLQAGVAGSGFSFVVWLGALLRAARSRGLGPGGGPSGSV